jgi:hypothetical protein
MAFGFFNLIMGSGVSYKPIGISFPLSGYFQTYCKVSHRCHVLTIFEYAVYVSKETLFCVCDMSS